MSEQISFEIDVDVSATYNDNGTITVETDMSDDAIVSALRAFANIRDGDDVVAHDLRALADSIEATSTDECNPLTADEVVSLIRSRYGGGLSHTNPMSIPNDWVYVGTPAREMDAPSGWEWATPPNESSDRREHLKPVEKCEEQIDTPEECVEYLRSQVDAIHPGIFLSSKFGNIVWVSSQHDDVVTLPDGWVHDETLHSPNGSYVVPEEDVPVDP